MTGAKERPRLVADIGGTNARFALAKEEGLPFEERVLAVADFPDITTAISAFLEGCSSPRPREAALAVAMPILGDRVTMTNNERWSFSIESTRKALNLERLVLVNDFTALALSLPTLKKEELRQVGGGEPVPHAPIGLLGPGTGLGTSGLVWGGSRWVPLKSEGGHVTFSPVSEREWRVAVLLKDRFGHTSPERILSGPGLENLYRALARLEGKEALDLDAAKITDQGLSGACPLCAEALEIFCGALGTLAGNLAVTLGAFGGIYIGGGIVPRLGGYFDRSPFRDRFEDKGRFRSYLAPIPAWVIVAENPALRGAARAFDL